MSKKKEPFILENVHIESVAAEGKAIAHIDGMVLFVEFAVPGDVVDVKVFKKKKNYMEGYTVRTVTPPRTGSSPSARISASAEAVAGSRSPIRCSWKPNGSRSGISWCAWDIWTCRKSSPPSLLRADRVLPEQTGIHRFLSPVDL